MLHWVSRVSRLMYFEYCSDQEAKDKAAEAAEPAAA